jgi:hypothetical protein
MVVLAVSQIYWARGVEQAVADGAVDKYLEQCTSDLMDLTDLVRGQLTDQQRMTLGALITVDVHARDVVQELVDAGGRGLTVGGGWLRWACLPKYFSGCCAMLGRGGGVQKLPKGHAAVSCVVVPGKMVERGWLGAAEAACQCVDPLSDNHAYMPLPIVCQPDTTATTSGNDVSLLGLAALPDMLLYPDGHAHRPAAGHGL